MEEGGARSKLVSLEMWNIVNEDSLPDSVATAKAEFFSISCNKLCKIMKIII
jgi:hypothetical protein